MDRGAWQIAVHGVAKSWKWLSDWAHTTMTLLTVFNSVQSLSHVQLLETPWTIACQVPCPSPIPGACSNSCPLSRWCRPTISSSVVHFCLQSFPASGFFFQWVSFSHQVPKYWTSSFSISPSNEYSGLVSFRIDWLDLLAVQGTLKSLLQHHSSKSINSLVLSFLYGPTPISTPDYWKNHCFG